MIMNVILVGLLSWFLVLLLETTNDIPLQALDSTIRDNKPLSTPSTDSGNGTLVLQNATLIDGTGTRPKDNSVIIINNIKIIAVSNQDNYLYNLSLDDINGFPKNERVLNLTGKYIIPGLFDMHAHVAGVRKNSYDQVSSENALAMLLDHGITTIRNPGGPTNETVHLREEIINGNLRGPEMFTAGRLLNTPEFPVPFVEKQVTTEEGVREEIRNQAIAGVDYIKLYVGMKPELVSSGR
jgi:imidazolonepropionase-like amidohydrolase